MSLVLKWDFWVQCLSISGNLCTSLHLDQFELLFYMYPGLLCRVDVTDLCLVVTSLMIFGSECKVNWSGLEVSPYPGPEEGFLQHYSKSINVTYLVLYIHIFDSAIAILYRQYVYIHLYSMCACHTFPKTLQATHGNVTFLVRHIQPGAHRVLCATNRDCFEASACRQRSLLGVFYFEFRCQNYPKIQRKNGP